MGKATFDKKKYYIDDFLGCIKTDKYIVYKNVFDEYSEVEIFFIDDYMEFVDIIFDHYKKYEYDEDIDTNPIITFKTDNSVNFDFHFTTRHGYHIIQSYTIFGMDEDKFHEIEKKIPEKLGCEIDVRKDEDWSWRKKTITEKINDKGDETTPEPVYNKYTIYTNSFHDDPSTKVTNKYMNFVDIVVKIKNEQLNPTINLYPSNNALRCVIYNHLDRKLYRYLIVITGVNKTEVKDIIEYMNRRLDIDNDNDFSDEDE